MEIKQNGNIGIGKTKLKSLITIEQSKEDFKNTYTLRGRIGIYIGIIIGLIDLKFTPPTK